MTKYYKPNNSTILYLNSSYNCIKSSSISLAITTQGSGYTSTPTINVISAAGDMGSGGSATANVVGGAITSLANVRNGQNYNVLPTITITGGGTPGVITGYSGLTGGSGYITAPSVSVSGGGGSGFSATCTITANVVSSAFTITSGGTGYITGQSLIFTGGGGSGAVATITASSGVITAISLTNAGTGYTSAPAITVSGSGAVITCSLSTNTISSTFTITNGGTGYITGQSLIFTGGGGSGAVATITATSGVITAISLTNAGTGYTSAPAITVSGSGAVISCVLAGGVSAINITNGGSNYSSTPTIVFTPTNGGSGASATPTINAGTSSVITPTFLKTYLYTWNIPEININDLAKISAINIIATNFVATTPYTYRLVGLQYDSRDSYFSDYGNPILSMAQNTNVCSYGSLGGSSFAIILQPQPIRQIQISVDDDIAKMNSGQAANINFVIALEIEEYDPNYTQVGDVYGEAANKIKPMY